MDLTLRIRTIKPEVCTSLTVADLTNDSVRLHWEHIWLYVDDEGRGIDDARLIKAALWPLDDRKTPKVIDGYQKELHDKNLIRRYTVKGNAYFLVVNWREHQRIDKPKDSIIPAPEQTGPETIADESTTVPGTVPDDSRLEGKGREQGTGREGNREPAVADAPENPSDPPGEFDEFWRAYPRRVDRGHAEKAWRQAVKRADPATIANAARRYGSDPNLPEPEFIPHPATWLNGQRWDDPPLPARTRANGNHHDPGTQAVLDEVRR